MSYSFRVKVTSREEAQHIRHILANMRVVEEVTEPVEEGSAYEEFLTAARKAKAANPFREIEDPLEWQRKQRDEWERDLDR